MYSSLQGLRMLFPPKMGGKGKSPLPPVYKSYRQKGFVGSGISSRSAQILSRSLRKEFEKSSVRGTKRFLQVV